MEKHYNYSLKKLNTFNIDVKAKIFTEVNSTEDIEALISDDTFLVNERLVLGGGSNILFTKDFDGIVVKIANKGITVVDEDQDFVYVKAEAGEVWDDLVDYCVMNNWGGLENLSLIPGQVGASPIQNIGAYGVEIKDVFHSLLAVNIFSGEKREFFPDDCRFGYRDSVFKNSEKGNYIIFSVVFKLKKHKHNINVDYGNIKDECAKLNITNPSIQDIRKIICSIRNAKLPEVGEIGSAGSFFKNPVVDYDKFVELKSKFPELVSFPDNDKVKLAAGWLIDKAGWKGFREGDYGVFPTQALVLVNYGNAKGMDVFSLGMKIIEKVRDMFGIELETEVNVL
ncbi:MAG: UDP-N-acetylmuramate dehydrogenase [Bacteroidetes bacterium]|nr:UDP-N-acetylmuramate dehydrogenase [Bacteroidota bacterium]